MYWTYVIQNKLGKTYIGQTDDLLNRLAMHNDIDPNKAKFHQTTYKKGPWELIYYENYCSRSEAISREKFFKTGKGRVWLKNKLGPR